jgi:hypothetical protein
MRLQSGFWEKRLQQNYFQLISAQIACRITFRNPSLWVLWYFQFQKSTISQTISPTLLIMPKINSGWIKILDVFFTHKTKRRKKKINFYFSTFFCGTGFIFYFFSFIHMCIQCLGHFSPLPPTPSLTRLPLPLPPTLSLPGRNYFALISNFVEERV